MIRSSSLAASALLSRDKDMMIPPPLFGFGRNDLLAFGEKLSIDDEITELFVLKFPSSILALVHSVRLFILFL
jgi:hypothetical protein